MSNSFHLHGPPNAVALKHEERKEISELSSTFMQTTGHACTEMVPFMISGRLLQVIFAD